MEIPTEMTVLLANKKITKKEALSLQEWAQSIGYRVHQHNCMCTTSARGRYVKFLKIYLDEQQEIQ